MDITHITSLLGGIALFLYGMSIKRVLMLARHY